MKKDTKRGRDSEKIPVSSKTTVLSSTDNIRRTIDVNNSDDSDEEFIDFIIGKYYNKKKGESEPKNYEYVRITKQINWSFWGQEVLQGLICKFSILMNTL